MDLRSALLLLGVVIILLVAAGAFGRGWLARRRERWHRARPPAAAHLEPQLEPPAGNDGPPPVIERNPGEYARVFGDSPPGGRPDEILDFIIHLPLEEPVERDEVFGLYRQREYDLDRPHALYGRASPDGEWSDVERDPVDAYYAELALALQLADAQGAASSAELNTLASIAIDIADAFDGRTLFLEDIDRALERAAGLERFFHAHDLIASIHVLASSAEGFGGRAIDQAAHRIGMQYGARNIYHLGESGARPLFILANLTQPGEFDLGAMNELRTPGLTLVLLVPCVRDPGEAFERMAGAAETLARVLDGRVLDSDRRALTPEALARSRGQIERIAAAMHAAGIPPGGATALRLFGDRDGL